MTRSFTVVLSPDPSGPWTAVCPSLPGAIAEGADRDRALRAIGDVIEGWLAVAEREGAEPLEETPELVARSIASVLEDRQAEGWDLTVETAAVTPGRTVAA